MKSINKSLNNNNFKNHKMQHLHSYRTFIFVYTSCVINGRRLGKYLLTPDFLFFSNF